MSSINYGTINDYETGEVIRRATREDWLTGRRDGEPQTGAHQTPEFGDLTIYIDGPAEDPAANIATIVNRTPHEIRVLRPGDPGSAAPVLVLPPADRGEVARVETTATPGWRLRVPGGEVRTIGQRWGAVVGLPDPRPGVFHVVSAIVAAGAKASGRECRDLLVPGDQVRDDRGRVVGCRGLAEAACSFPTMAVGAVVWTAYSPDELIGLGVPEDIVTAAADGRTMHRIAGPASDEEIAAWRAMSGLYQAQFGGPGPRPRSSDGHVDRLDLAELAEALMHRPHRRAIASVAD